MNDLARRILTYVKTRGQYVTFVDLVRELGEISKGNVEMILDDDPNLVLWSGLSEELFEALQYLLERDEIFFHPVSRFTYLLDGGGLDLPIANGPPEQIYTSKHWFQVCFCTFPLTPAVNPEQG